jgi:hypothetical protein
VEILGANRVDSLLAFLFSATLCTQSGELARASISRTSNE